MSDNQTRSTRLYTIKDISELSGISEGTLIRMIMLRRVKAVRIGKSLRVTEAEFEDFMGKLQGLTGKTLEFFTPSELVEPVIYTAEQVARILQLSVDNVWLLLKSGELKGFKLREGRSSWRITKKDLNKFIESRARQF